MNNFNKNNLNKNKNNNVNQLPMTMKGDFVSLIEQNPKIMEQKNPRLQVTNATCDLNQIINNENNEDDADEENNEINNLDNNYKVDKNKVLNRVIQNCDTDLYAQQKPSNSRNDQWYSVSIPLNNNEAKWEFLNNIKGERDKNNLNKFELIQKEIDPNKNNEKVEEPYNTKTFKPVNAQKNNVKDNSYKLSEMNYSQFYRSPIRPRKMNEEEKTDVGGTVIRRPGKKKKLHGSASVLGLSRQGDNSIYNGRNNNNRNKGRNQYGSRNKSIENDEEYDEYNYSEE